MTLELPSSSNPVKAMILLWVLLLGGTGVADFFNPSPPGLDLFLGRGSRNLWNGKVARRLDDFFQNRSLVFARTRPFFAAWIYRLTGEVHSEVGIGRDGWLFHQWTLDDRGKEGERATEKGIRALAAVRDLLKKHDVEFLLVVVPSKVRIYPEHMYPGGRLPAHIEPAYRRFYENLRAREIPAIDLEGLFQNAKKEDSRDNHLYYTADHHWTDRGCHRAASAIAAWIRDRHPEWCNRTPGLAQLKPPLRVSGEDGLYRMLGFKPGESRDDFVKDSFRSEVAYRKTPSEAERGDSPITLTGDSFAAFLDQMPSYLELELQTPVRRAAVMGGETHAGIDRWLKSGALGRKRAQLLVCVVWEATLIGHPLTDLEQVLSQYRAP